MIVGLPASFIWLRSCLHISQHQQSIANQSLSLVIPSPSCRKLEFGRSQCRGYILSNDQTANFTISSYTRKGSFSQIILKHGEDWAFSVLTVLQRSNVSVRSRQSMLALGRLGKDRKATTLDFISQTPLISRLCRLGLALAHKIGT
jgi:hypothetical protein